MRALAVLGHEAWQQLFGGGPAAVNRPVRIHGEAYTVSAVMPKGFAWPRGAKLWLLSPLPVPPSPIDMKDPLTNRDVQYFQSIARLKPGVTLAQARQDLHAIGVTIQQEHAQTSGGRDLRAMPIRENLVRACRIFVTAMLRAVSNSTNVSSDHNARRSSSRVTSCPFLETRRHSTRAGWF